jgi:hypothetical protein
MVGARLQTVADERPATAHYVGFARRHEQLLRRFSKRRVTSGTWWMVNRADFVLQQVCVIVCCLSKGRRRSSSSPARLMFSGIHSGTGALSMRFTKRFGRWLESLSRRLSEHPEPNLFSFGIVKRVTTHLDVTLPRVDLPGNRLEQWTSDNIITHIPGAKHAPK